MFDMPKKEYQVIDMDNQCEDFSSADRDDRPICEINNQFVHRFVEIEQVKVTTKGTTCTSLFTNNLDYIASVLSDNTIIIIDKKSLQTISSFKPHKKDITDIKFSPQNPHLIYSSCIDGTIMLWDFKSNKEEKTINANADRKMPLTSLDVSQNEKLACAGTERVGSDSFILFWDLRGNKLLGGYNQSHSDDISYVKFNPDNNNTIASAGADGLINVFDVSQSSEDEALMYSLNSEDIVNSFIWRNENKKMSLLAFTDVHSIQLWNVEEGIPTYQFKREEITRALRRNATYECYPTKLCMSAFERNPIILAGSGLEHEGNSCLRTLQINEKNGCLQPHGLLVSKDDNISSITQVASFAPGYTDLITVREDGVISVWKENLSVTSFKSTKTKKKIKPY